MPITIIEDSEFVNNFGDTGASLAIWRGGGLYTKNCFFNLDSSYGDQIRVTSNSQVTSEAMSTKANLLRSGYKSTLPKRFLVDDDYE